MNAPFRRLDLPYRIGYRIGLWLAPRLPERVVLWWARRKGYDTTTWTVALDALDVDRAEHEMRVKRLIEDNERRK